MVDPDFCPVVYTTQVSDLTCTEDPITAPVDGTELSTPPSFSWFYDSDRCPIDDNSPSEQDVTVTATSTSIYGTSSTPVSDDEPFKVVYDDPCCNADLVTITVNPSLVFPSSDDYSGSNIIFDYGTNAYTVDPPICALSVVCEGVSPTN